MSRLLTAVSVLVLSFGGLVAGPLAPVASAHVPSASSACYWSALKNNTRTHYFFNTAYDGYSKLKSSVNYKVGYDCVGRAILALVTFREATYSTSSPVWQQTTDHTIGTYSVFYDASIGASDHVGPNSAYYPRKSCIGKTCSIYVSTGTDVLVEHHQTWNEIYFSCSLCAFEPSTPVHHCFLRNAMSESRCNDS